MKSTTETIGVSPKALLRISELKQLFQLYDKVGILTEHDVIAEVRERDITFDPEIFQFLNEYEYLVEQEIVFNPISYYEDREPPSDPEYDQMKRDFERKIKEMKRIIMREGGKINPHVMGKISTTRAVAQELIARLVSLQLRKTQTMDSYPIVPLSENSSSEFIKKLDMKKALGLQVLVKNLPIPDELTSWEQLIDFRKDPETHRKFVALKNWVNDISKSELTASEIENKIEFLINQYEEHMKLHRIKIKPGIIETCLTLPAEALENLLKLRWGKLAKSLFTLKHRKINLMEAELKAPGRELNYIIRANMKFQR